MRIKTTSLQIPCFSPPFRLLVYQSIYHTPFGSLKCGIYFRDTLNKSVFHLGLGFVSPQPIFPTHNRRIPFGADPLFSVVLFSLPLLRPSFLLQYFGKL